MKKLFYLIILLLCSCAATSHLRYPPARWIQDTDNAPMTLPEEKQHDKSEKSTSGGIDNQIFSQATQIFEKTTEFTDQLADPDINRFESVNTNNFDEVADSSWFTNRIGRYDLSPEEIAKVTEIKLPVTFVTKNIVKDKTGAFYLLAEQQNDEDEIIANRVMRAFGYNVPEKQIIYIKGKRMVAAKFLKGTAIGTFSFKGKKKGDPNDRLPHEYRRELRGFKVLCGFLQVPEFKSSDTLDIYDGYIKHYISGLSPIIKKPVVKAAKKSDYKTSMSALFSFGLYDPYWSTVDDGSATGFDLRNPLFKRTTMRDAFWAAKILSRFTDADITAIVHEAKFQDPNEEKKKVEELIDRRNKVTAFWLNKYNSLDNFTVVGTTISFDDLSGKKESYTYRLKTTKRNIELISWTEITEPQILFSQDVIKKMEHGKIYILEIKVNDKPIEVFVKNENEIKILGLKRR